MTGIEWTDATWNPTTGCDRVTPGCDHCYALTLAPRLKAMGQAKYQRDGDPRTSGPGFGITEHGQSLYEPLRWRKPRRVFVNSMSDLFHAGVSDDFVSYVWATMALAPQHTYQVLTKRHGRMRSLLGSPEFEEAVRLKVRHFDDESDAYHREVATWPLPNVWVGVSVEDQKRADLRVPALLDTPAAVRFLSCEPLLGPVDLSRWVDHFPWNYTEWGLECSCGAPMRDEQCLAPGLDWVIGGGESGPGARPLDPEWPRQLRDHCADGGVPFFFKQWGGRTPKAAGRELDGRTHDEYPATRQAVPADA